MTTGNALGDLIVLIVSIVLAYKLGAWAEDSNLPGIIRVPLMVIGYFWVAFWVAIDASNMTGG